MKEGGDPEVAGNELEKAAKENQFKPANAERTDQDYEKQIKENVRVPLSDEQKETNTQEATDVELGKLEQFFG